MRASLPYEGAVHSGNLRRFELDYEESRITVLCDKNLRDEADEELRRNYLLLRNYIKKNPFFAASYEPVPVGRGAPEIAARMAKAANTANVGPMASVAGSFSEIIRDYLLSKGAGGVVVENGGDISLKVSKEITVGIYAGASSLSEKMALRIKPESTPLGICTSSGSVGHSVSLGDSDAVVAVSRSTPLADAAATSIGNVVKGEHAVRKGIKRAREIEGILGVIIIKNSELGCWGELPEII